MSVVRNGTKQHPEYCRLHGCWFPQPTALDSARLLSNRRWGNFSDYSEKSLHLQTNSITGRWLFCLFGFFFSDFFSFLNVRNSFVRSEFKEFDKLSAVFTSKKSAEVCPYPFFPGTYVSPQFSGLKFGKSGTGDKFKQGLGKEWERPHEIHVFPGFPGETNANGSKFRSCTPENNL